MLLHNAPKKQTHFSLLPSVRPKGEAPLPIRHSLKQTRIFTPAQLRALRLFPFLLHFFFLSERLSVSWTCLCVRPLLPSLPPSLPFSLQVFPLTRGLRERGVFSYTGVRGYKQVHEGQLDTFHAGRSGFPESFLWISFSAMRKMEHCIQIMEIQTCGTTHDKNTEHETRDGKNLKGRYCCNNFLKWWTSTF